VNSHWTRFHKDMLHTCINKQDALIWPPAS